MTTTKYLIILCVGILGALLDVCIAADEISAGPLFQEFDLTLTPGSRKEIVSPFYYSEQKGDQHTWAIPPLTIAYTADPTIHYREFDFAYPILTFDQFGSEYRLQFFQLFAFAGGNDTKDDRARRFTLFPVYFQQRSPDPDLNYTAVVPFYGTIKNRLFRDEIHFVMFPLFSKTRKRDVVNYNMPYPIFCLTYGDGLRGWQVWPLVGHEHKEVTTRTNMWGESESVPGYDTKFVLWPFYTKSETDIGSTNPVHQEALIPAFSITRSKMRDSTTYAWPIGVTHTQDREKGYKEWDAPWPLIVFARGEHKHTDRVWPFMSQATNQFLESDWYLWPIYKFNRVHSGPLDRSRTRIAFFLYSDVTEKNTETGKALHRQDLWPLFTHRKDFDGRERLQILSVIEPVLPANKSVERDYSYVYSVWRAEKNPLTGASSQSLLWNMYRREAAPQRKKISLLFGLFQYQSTPEGTHWRVCYIPAGKAKKSPAREPSAQR